MLNLLKLPKKLKLLWERHVCLQNKHPDAEVRTAHIACVKVGSQ